METKEKLSSVVEISQMTTFLIRKEKKTNFSAESKNELAKAVKIL